MTARILRGKEVSEPILASLAERTMALATEGVVPGLAFVTVGDSSEGQMYLQRLQRLGARLGIQVTHRALAPDASSADLEACVTTLNTDDSVDGVIVQFPLPAHVKFAELASTIDPRKDVDGITVANVGRLYSRLPGHIPSTAAAMMEILSSAGIEPAGKRAVVIGRSNVVGRPVAELLVQRNATVTIVHTRTRDLGAITREAEILMAAAGKPRMVTVDMISPGVVIVDAGINVTEDGLVGDVAFNDCSPVAGAISPVPGGVGVVTNAVLLRNVVDSAEHRGG